MQFVPSKTLQSKHKIISLCKMSFIKQFQLYSNIKYYIICWQSIDNQESATSQYRYRGCLSVFQGEPSNNSYVLVDSRHTKCDQKISGLVFFLKKIQNSPSKQFTTAATRFCQRFCNYSKQLWLSFSVNALRAFVTFCFITFSFLNDLPCSRKKSLRGISISGDYRGC